MWPHFSRLVAVYLIEVTSFLLSAVVCNRAFLTARKSVAQDR
jgi:hypothetical protein